MTTNFTTGNSTDYTYCENHSQCLSIHIIYIQLWGSDTRQYLNSQLHKYRNFSERLRTAMPKVGQDSLAGH